MVRNSPNAHRYWKFEPPSVLNMRHVHPGKIENMQKKLRQIMPAEGQELKAGAPRNRIHPILRDMLPAGSTRKDFEAVIEDLDHAKQLSTKGFQGPHFYPAVVDLGKPIQNWEPTKRYPVKVFVDPPGGEKHLFMPIAYVTPRAADKYLIEAFGMQHSDPQKFDGVHKKAKAEKAAHPEIAKEGYGEYHDIRKGVPEGLHGTFDLGAPSLGLALTSSLLRMSGAQMVALPGERLQWQRKGTRRPQSLNYLKQKLHDPDYAGARDGIRYLIDNFNKLSGPEVRAKLRELMPLVKASRPFATAYGIPKPVINRNYTYIPESLGAREILAYDALHPNPQLFILTNPDWRIPEPHKHMGLKAYDLNMPTLDHLSHFLKPMEPAEISVWKKRMRSRGINVNKIDAIAPST